MKLNTLLFSFIVLPLFIQCNTITRSKNHHKLLKQSHASRQPDSILADDVKPEPVSDNSNSATGIKQENHKNPFGILVDRTDNAAISVDKKIAIAKALGFNYVRVRTDIDTYNGTINNYDDFAAAGLKIILNINYSVPRSATGEKQPVAFPTDLEAYNKTFTSILDKYKPELVVVENEEDNPFYHSGSADDYINELKTAITICHSKGLKVTNGGLTEREMMLLVFDDLISNGKTQEAYDFASRAMPQQYLSKLKNYQKLPMVQRALTFGRAVMQAYKTLNIDYVNLHWYEPSIARGKMNNDALNTDHIDSTVFAAVVNYLKRTTGKPVITNEFGVLNTSPTLIQELMQQVLNANMDYAIFYSGDGAGGSQALQNGDASLRQTGVAVRDFIKQHCK